MYRVKAPVTTIVMFPADGLSICEQAPHAKEL